MQVWDVLLALVTLKHPIIYSSETVLGKYQAMTPFKISCPNRPSLGVYSMQRPTPHEQKGRCVLCLEDGVIEGTESKIKVLYLEGEGAVI